MSAALTRVLAKERQARVHWQTLAGEIKTFLREHPPRTVGHFDEGDTLYEIVAQDVHPVPESIALLIGDVVHNARSCLEHLAHELVDHPTGRTAFPLHLIEPRNRQGEVIPTTIQGGLREEIRQVVESLQPYVVTPNAPSRNPLAILSKLDNIDKHRIILPTLGSFTAAADGWHHDRSKRRPDINYGPLRDGGWVARYYFDEPSPHVTVDFHLIPCVAFGEHTPLQDGDDVITVLDTLMRHVAATVKQFQRFL